MIYLIFLFLFQNIIFGQEDLSPIFLSNKNSFQYYDAGFYNEFDNFLTQQKKSNTNIIMTENLLNTNTVIQRTPIPEGMYDLTNYASIHNFFSAIQNGDTYQILDLLKQGIHPDVRTLSDISNGITSLMTATASRRVLIVRLLLFEGADPNLTSYSLGISNITPLMIAAQQGPLENVREILNHGAIINAVTTVGSTALMAAVKAQRIDIVQFLLSRNADVNIATTSGEISNITALMIAAQTGNIPIVQQLVNTPDIDIHVSDSVGRNALVYAYISGNIQLINQLTTLGLKTDLTPKELQQLVQNNFDNN